MEISIIDFSSDVVFNYFCSIFVWMSVLIVPVFAALNLFKES